MRVMFDLLIGGTVRCSLGSGETKPNESDLYESLFSKMNMISQETNFLAIRDFFILLIVILSANTIGGAARFAGNRLRLPSHGYRGGCRGRLERSAVLRTQKLQSPRRKDSAGL